MEIEFRNADLERRFSENRLAVRSWGAGVARKYVTRILQISKARDQADLRTIRALRLHALKGQRHGKHAIDLQGRWRLIITFQEGTVIIEEVTNHYDD